MGKNDETKAEGIALRVRVMQTMLFGNLTRNDLRKAGREVLTSKGRDTIHQLATDTSRALLDQVVGDSSLAPLYLARLARTKPHSFVMFLALDAAAMGLMNPSKTPGHTELVKQLASKSPQPVALVMACLARL